MRRASDYDEPILPVDRSGDLELSFAQQRLWFLDQLVPDNPFYNIASAYRLQGALDAGVLSRALSEITARHEALRTRFLSRGGRPCQVVDASQPIELEMIDLSGADDPVSEARHVARAEATAPFDLAKDRLLRTRLLRLGPTDHVLLMTVHHIVLDGWSQRILLEELGVLYGAFVAGEPSPLVPLAIQYGDFASWQRGWLTGETLNSQLGYWRDHLAHTAPLELPTDRPRPAVLSHAGATFSFEVPAKVTGELRRLGQSEGATLFMVLLGCFESLLGRYSGQEEVLVSAPIAGRVRPEIEDLIGLFINTLVLSGDLSGDPSLRELIVRVREDALGAYAHQDLPFEQLVDALNVERDLSRNPLVQVMFQLFEPQHSALDRTRVPGWNLELAGLEVTRFGGGPQSVPSSTRLDLEVYMSEQPDGGLVGTIAYASDLFDASSIEAMATYFVRLLTRAAAEPDQALSRISLLDKTMRHQLLVEWNDTTTEYPTEQSIAELFEAQVTVSPDSVALVFEETSLSYGELNEVANRLAHHLRDLGVGPEVIVGLCLERGIEMIVSLLAILKAGGAYLPLDPDYPPDRISFMLEDAAAPVVVTTRPLAERLGSRAGRLVLLDEEAGLIGAHPTENPTALSGPDNLAYVIYTSGSTGRPKGVMVNQRGVVNLGIAQREAFCVTADDRVLQFASISFDASVADIFTAFAAGAALCVARHHVDVPSEIGALGASVATLTPSNVASWKTTELASLTTLIVAGEACSAEIVSRWGVGRVLMNVYGPTEATVVATLGLCDPEDLSPPPIGKPLANTSCYVLDEHLEPVPVGLPGELYIGGIGVARGYLGRPGLTAERFLPDPFSSEPGSRLYRTGDLVRHRSDGNLEFLGRLDDQIKLRGFRIELGEIESVLATHPQVRDAAVVVREDDGDRRLVAYVVSASESTPGPPELREYLHNLLPHYMVPAAFVVLESLPMNLSGKLDRRTLPSPPHPRSDPGELVVARSATENVLAGIWADVLALDAVGVEDNFFELGGHSLLAIQVVARARELELHLEVADLFLNQTVSTLAQRVKVRA